MLATEPKKLGIASKDACLAAKPHTLTVAECQRDWN